MSQQTLNTEPQEPKTGHDYLLLAEKERESENFQGALTQVAKAEALYKEEGNVAGLAQSFASEFLIHRHLYEQNGNGEDKAHAQAAIEESVGIIKESGQKVGLGIPLYNLAKWYELTGEYEKSVESMKEALEALDASPDDPQSILSVKAEIGTRLASIAYRLGDESARLQFDKALSDLISNPNPDEYTQKVWVSGAHLHLADSMIARGDHEGARVEIAKAGIVINSDPRLTLRAKQLAKLQQKLA